MISSKRVKILLKLYYAQKMIVIKFDFNKVNLKRKLLRNLIKFVYHNNIESDFKSVSSFQ